PARRHSDRAQHLSLYRHCGSGAVLAGSLRRGQPAQYGCGYHRSVLLWDHRASAAPDPQHAAHSGRSRHFADHPVSHHHPDRAGDPLLHLSLRPLTAAGMTARPWTIGAEGLMLSLRLTPKGGRDAIEGIDILADGRAVLRARVRAAASEGAANAALASLLSKALGVAASRI